MNRAKRRLEELGALLVPYVARSPDMAIGDLRIFTAIALDDLRGRAPRAADIAHAFDLADRDVANALRRLAAAGLVELTEDDAGAAPLGMTDATRRWVTAP